MSTVPVKTDPTAPDQGATREDRDRSAQEALIDFESEQSFPASDPPSWTFGPDKARA